MQTRMEATILHPTGVLCVHLSHTNDALLLNQLSTLTDRTCLD